MPEHPDLQSIAHQDGRYPTEAYEFLHQGLQRAIYQRHGAQPSHEPKNVTGQEICWALRDLAQKEWGMLAPTVLARWNISSTIDFGNILYVLIDKKAFGYGKSADDHIDHFHEVYDFRQAFSGAYDFELKE